MVLHFMSDKELARLEVLRDLASGRLTVAAASELLGLERRQVQRLSKAYQEQGAIALISKKRGRVSNRQTPPSLKAQALEVIRGKYADFGPTLAAEKLRELHGIYIGRETLRLWRQGGWPERVDQAISGPVEQFIDIAGASGSVYRFHRVSSSAQLPVTAGNFLFMRPGPDGDALICCGMTRSLALARAAWNTAVEQHQATSIFVRLNVSRLIRVAEHDDIVAKQRPILAFTDQG